MTDRLLDGFDSLVLPPRDPEEQAILKEAREIMRQLYNDESTPNRMRLLNIIEGMHGGLRHPR